MTPPLTENWTLVPYPKNNRLQVVAHYLGSTRAPSAIATTSSQDSPSVLQTDQLTGPWPICSRFSLNRSGYRLSALAKCGGKALVLATYPCPAEKSRG